MFFVQLLWAVANYLVAVTAINPTSLPWWSPDFPGLNASSEEVFTRRSFFYVGGKYVNSVSRHFPIWFLKLMKMLYHRTCDRGSNVCRETRTPRRPPAIPNSVH
jgi:hypothetical protein